MSRGMMRGILAVGLALGMFSASTAAYAALAPGSGPVQGGTQVTVDAPTEVSFTSISANWSHTLALDTDGNPWAWGDNANGQLGTGNSIESESPTPVAAPTDITFTTASAGENHSLALDTNGKIWAWGANLRGQLGTGNNTGAPAPIRVATPAGVTFTAVSAGSVHSLALDTGGNAWAWGSNYSGQLGNGNNTNTNAPALVATPPGITFTTIDASAFHSLALDTDGNAWAWGDNDSGQLGNGSNTNTNAPALVATPPGVTFTTLDADWYYSVALDTDGNGWAWGDNYEGQLGIGNNTDTNTPVLIAAPTGVTFTTVKPGASHSLALDTDGNTWAWGDNYLGQLGTGNNTSANAPALVSTPAGTTVTTIVPGAHYSLAIDTDGNTWAWGDNRSGQLGTGNIDNTNTPTQVPMTVIVTGVSFADLPGTDLTDNGDGTWTATTPTHPAGPVDVTVNWTLNGVKQAPIVHEGGFTYLDPATVPTVTDPVDVTVAAGDTATFTTAVTGDPDPEIIWEYSTDSGMTWVSVTATDGAVGADGTNLLVTTTKAHNGYQYRVAATNAAGTDTSAPAILTVIAKDVDGGNTGGGNTGGGNAAGGNTAGGSLSSTGSDNTPLIAGALLLAGTGTALALNARLRKTARN